MSAAIVHRVSNEFDDRNLFLQVTLGLVSWSRWLRTRLERHAPVVARRPDGLDRNADAFLHFVLGFVSVSETVMTHLGRVEPSPRRRSPAAARGRRIVPRRLLR